MFLLYDWPLLTEEANKSRFWAQIPEARRAYDFLGAVPPHAKKKVALMATSSFGARPEGM
jgi:hypothetical protein